MREYRAITARIARDGPSHVLDWGCGWGQVTKMLRGAGVDVTAFDYSEAMEADRVCPLERYPGLEAYLSSEPVQLPYESGAFDAVLSCGVLEHVHDPDGSLEEIKRVLRPGGTFYLYKLPNRYSYLERIARWVGLYYHGAEPNDRVYTKRAAYRLLGRHGFRITEFRRMNLLPLTVTGRWAETAARPIWFVNRALSGVPALNLLATNLELVATSPP
jgi:2-polyprenyl-3-methyl-5-hydroxy-6-metoxy-1,4-benzoquinol methylase